MATVTMKELLEAGVHFGHQVRRWNPKMKEFIFGERNGIYIIDLQKTQRMFKDAIRFITELTSEGSNKTVLFVGTKRQAQDAIKEEAARCNQYYINQRWLGGLLTNFQTVQKSIKRLKEIEAMQADNRIEAYAKKERLQIEREKEALEKNLLGIKDMKRLPDLIFIIDTNKEEIAVKEANRLGIPVVAIVDTNCTPEGIDYVIPGNDDALRAVRLFASRVADAIMEGQQLATQKEAEEAAIAAEQRAAAGATTEINPRGRERGERGERGDRGGRGRGDRDRGGRGERGAGGGRGDGRGGGRGPGGGGRTFGGPRDGAPRPRPAQATGAAPAPAIERAEPTGGAQPEPAPVPAPNEAPTAPIEQPVQTAAAAPAPTPESTPAVPETQAAESAA